MGLLPNYQQAIIRDEKLAGYCLNEEHPVGKDKAFLFRMLLNITEKESDWFKQQILLAVSKNDVVASRTDEYGQRYTVDFSMYGNGRTCQIRTSWIILKSDDKPLLTSCYIL